MAYHKDDYVQIIRHVRDFFRVEANVEVPGPARINADYATFQGWMTEKKIYEGHSEREALSLPTRERLDEMRAWMDSDQPTDFVPA